MRIHVLSDLHTEFPPYLPAPAAARADVVVLAGDIGVRTRGVEWAKRTFRQPTFYVPGNHEYYGGHLHRTLLKMSALNDERFMVADCDEMIVGDVRLLGFTAWTDYTATGNLPLATWDARSSMADFRAIRIGSYRKVVPEDFIRINIQSRQWLEHKLAEPFGGRTVVVTHHAPSMASLQGNGYAASHLDGAYANRWEHLMGSQIALWIHGHSHHAVDYEIAGTRIVSNPKGYPGERCGFCPDLIVEI